MCAHIGQNRDNYPPSIYGVYFRLVPPPPFAQVEDGGCYREKFFFDFNFLIFARIYRMFGLRIIFLFFQNIVSTRYNISLRIFSFALRFPTLIIILDSMFFDSVFRLVLLVEFYSHQFRLVSALSILCFNSSTLYLFNSSACYKQTSMLM